MRELIGHFEAAIGIGDVFVDLGGVAREPVERRARGLERLVEFAEQQRLDRRAFAARPQPPALETGDAPPDPQDRRRGPLVPDSTAPASSPPRSAMNVWPMNEPMEWPRKTRGRPGKSAPMRRWTASRSAEALAPAVRVGEEAEIGGRAFRAVAAMVARRHDIARGGQRPGEPLVARAVLGKAVRDLHRSARARRQETSAAQRSTGPRVRPREPRISWLPPKLRGFAAA